MRLVTYNIRAGLGMDNVRSIRRVGDVLRGLSPDIACLQEVDQRLPRSWPCNQPAFLARYLGMQAVFQRNINLWFGGYGNCVLSRPGIVNVRRHSLPGDGEPRGLLEVTIQLAEGELVVFCTHLALDEEVRVGQARRVGEIVRAASGVKVLCGDINDIRGSQTLSTLLQDSGLRDVGLEMGAQDIPTMHEPYLQCIDFVLADHRLQVNAYEVIHSDASDHHPVVVDMELAR